MSSDNESFLETSISSDIGLKIIQYLNVVDSGRLAAVSQRYYYLVQQYRRLRGPELVTTAANGKSSDDMVKECKKKIQTMPNLVLNFSTARFSDCTPTQSFGSETVSLGVISPHEIQVCQPGQKGTRAKLDDKDEDALMAMNFPGASVLPFSIGGEPSALDFEFLEHRLNYHNTGGDQKFWKGLILYATQASDALIGRMQKFMPNAVIVGGICRDGHVSCPKFSKEELVSMSIKKLRYLLKKYMPEQQFQSGIVEKSDLVDKIFETMQSNPMQWERIDDDSLFGVFLGGDVPIRSVVSRGVHSILNKNGPPRPFSELVVHETEFSKPGSEGYLFGANGPPVHYITKIKDKSDGKIYKPMGLFQKYSTNMYRSQYLGLKRKGRDGFELSEMNNLAMELNIFVVVTDGSPASEDSLEGAEMDFFTLNGKACMEDMDRSMLMLREQTEGEEILGAVMYTCCARGPSQAGFIPEQMSDATRFAKAFPEVPCLGFYANGEFGPMALAGNENVFQSGRSAHQGCTAVFALFIVPVKDGSSFYNLDDSVENVRKFVEENLHSGKSASTPKLMEF